MATWVGWFTFYWVTRVTYRIVGWILQKKKKKKKKHMVPCVHTLHLRLFTIVSYILCCCLRLLALLFIYVEEDVPSLRLRSGLVLGSLQHATVHWFTCYLYVCYHCTHLVCWITHLLDIVGSHTVYPFCCSHCCDLLFTYSHVYRLYRLRVPARRTMVAFCLLLHTHVPVPTHFTCVRYLVALLLAVVGLLHSFRYHGSVVPVDARCYRPFVVGFVDHVYSCTLPRYYRFGAATHTLPLPTTTDLHTWLIVYTPYPFRFYWFDVGPVVAVPTLRWYVICLLPRFVYVTVAHDALRLPTFTSLPRRHFTTSYVTTRSFYPTQLGSVVVTHGLHSDPRTGSRGRSVYAYRCAFCYIYPGYSTHTLHTHDHYALLRLVYFCLPHVCSYTVCTHFTHIAPTPHGFPSLLLPTYSVLVVPHAVPIVLCGYHGRSHTVVTCYVRFCATHILRVLSTGSGYRLPTQFTLYSLPRIAPFYTWTRWHYV